MLAGAALLGCGADGAGPRARTATGNGAEWGYAGAGGPEHWASLSGAFSACSGRQQSPVNITGAVLGERGPLVFSYGIAATAVRNDGTFVHCDYPEGNALISDGRAYGLQSVHMHAPSEHAIDGARFAAELHLVHADPAGRLAAVGVLFALGEPHGAVQALLDAAPAVGETVDGGGQIVPARYLPTGPSYFRYEGSKTTPPCEEGVVWHVMRGVQTISARQRDILLAVGGGPTNRPIQPRRARRISLEGVS